MLVHITENNIRFEVSHEDGDIFYNSGDICLVLEGGYEDFERMHTKTVQLWNDRNGDQETETVMIGTDDDFQDYAIVNFANAKPVQP